jgi:hypothetical protein
MGAVEVVEVFPLLELVVEQLGVVDHDAVEHPVELLGVDTVGSLHLAVEPRAGGLGVDVADPAVQDVVVERALELGAVEFLSVVKGFGGVHAGVGTSGVSERLATPFLTGPSRRAALRILEIERRAARISSGIW